MRHPLFPVVIVLLQIGAFLGLASCTTAAHLAAVREGFDVALCVADHQDEPLDQVIARCLRENVTAEDVSAILARQKRVTERAATARSCPKP